MDNNKVAFENVLQRINKYISLKSEERRLYTNDFENICRALLNEVQKEDPLFYKDFYNGDLLSGSYVDNLKISKPDEFDLVLRLKFRLNKLIKVERDTQKPGYVKLNFTEVLNAMKNRKEDALIYEKLKKKLVDENNYLIQNELQSWIEGIFTRVLTKNNYKLKRNGICYDVKYSKCGPAHTIKITKEDRKLSIDFVPGIVFDKTSWPALRAPPDFSITNWIAVPKPIKNNTTNKNNLSFQTSYVDTERILITKTNNLKNVLRMIKKLRDRHNIVHLKSYFIKTVFLWENNDKPSEFWNGSAAKILLYMLEKIIEYVERGQMPFFWYKKENMFAPLSETQLKATLDLIKKVHKLILKYKDEDPKKLYDLFLTPEEIEDMNQNSNMNMTNLLVSIEKTETKAECKNKREKNNAPLPKPLLPTKVKGKIIEQSQNSCVLS